MKATVQSWKLQPSGEEYPVLAIEALPEEHEEIAALEKLAKICQGIPGKGFRNSLAAINNPDTRGWRTSFAVDLGTLLTMCSTIEFEKAKKAYATGWLKTFVDAKQTEWNPRITDEELRCRCGQYFKNKKFRDKHLKKCPILLQDSALITRTKEALKMVGKVLTEKVTKVGKKHGNKAHKGSKLVHTKGNEVGPKSVVRKGTKRAAKKTQKRKVH